MRKVNFIPVKHVYINARVRVRPRVSAKDLLTYITRQKAARADFITPMRLGPASLQSLEDQNKPF